MEVIKVDRRTRRTLSAIREAFITLVNQKDISKITIRDIAELADINRATFYLHYTDLLKNPYPILLKLGELLDSEPQLAKYILKAGTKSKYFLKIKTGIKHRALNSFESNKAGDLYYILNYVTAGALDTFEDWIESGKTVPLEKLCENLSKFIVGGINAFMTYTQSQTEKN
jgi:hypothetical protein